MLTIWGIVVVHSSVIHSCNVVESNSCWHCAMLWIHQPRQISQILGSFSDTYVSYVSISCYHNNNNPFFEVFFFRVNRILLTPSDEKNCRQIFQIYMCGKKISIPWIYIFLLLALKNSNKELIPKSVHYDSCFCIVILAFFFTNMNIADFTTPKLAKSCWTKP